VTRLRVAAVAAATAAWVIGTVTGDLAGWAFGLTVTAGAVLTAVAVGLPLLAEHRTRRRAVAAERIAEDASARMRLVLDDALEPLAYLVGRITDEPRDDGLRGQAVAVVLAAAAEVLGGPRLRSCWFALDPGPPARLVNAGFSGRAEPPRTTFVAGTPLGDTALALLAERSDLFCRDARADPPPGWDPAAHDYRTFIVVPVATEGRAFGIVTIDGLAAGDLSERDVTAVRVFARLLAAALNTPVAQVGRGRV
jgi:GAF domain-containing protein